MQEKKLPKMLFLLISLPEKAVIATAENGYFPSCILSKDLMYVPTFDTNQEKLISNVSML